MTEDAKRRWVERRCYGVRWQVLVPVLLLSVAAALFCIGYFTRPGVTRKAAAPAAVNANAVQPVPSCIVAVNSSLVKDVCSQRYPRLPMKWRSSKSKVLALTFDDGPWAVGLTKVLDVLAAHSIKGAFFVNTDVGSPAMGAPMGSYVAPQNMVSSCEHVGLCYMGYRQPQRTASQCSYTQISVLVLYVCLPAWQQLHAVHVTASLHTCLACG
jgi:hypothetical protein